MNKFRSFGDTAPWLLKFWQLVSGDFMPYNVNKDGKFFSIEDEQMSQIIDYIIHQRGKMVCLNDSDDIHHFEKDKKQLLEAFNILMPKKCRFEL